jgi:hypothetical protein
MMIWFELGSTISIENMTQVWSSTSSCFETRIPGTDMTRFCLRCQYLVMTSLPLSWVGISRVICVSRGGYSKIIGVVVQIVLGGLGLRVFRRSGRTSVVLMGHRT